MKFLLFLSEIMIPLVIFIIVGYGLLKKKSIYEDFIRGAADGIRIVIKIMPTLIGLMVAVGVLRASGFLELFASLLGRMTNGIGFPSQLVPLAIIRMFSSSAATGMALDLFKEYGADSLIGTTASIMLGCTETIFYTMSVYFMAAKVTKTRWTFPGALLSTIAGIATSVLLARWMV